MCRLQRHTWHEGSCHYCANFPTKVLTSCCEHRTGFCSQHFFQIYKYIRFFSCSHKSSFCHDLMKEFIIWLSCFCGYEFQFCFCFYGGHGGIVLGLYSSSLTVQCFLSSVFAASSALLSMKKESFDESLSRLISFSSFLQHVDFDTGGDRGPLVCIHSTCNENKQNTCTLIYVADCSVSN